MKLAALFVIVGLGYLIVSGGIHFSYNAGFEPEPGAAASGPTVTPVVEDVIAIVNAASSAESLREGKALNSLLDRAAARRSPEGAALIEHRLPRLARRIQSELLTLREGVVDVEVTTTIGRDCRRRTVEELARQGHLLRLFVAGVAAHRTWPAVGRFRAQSDRFDDWYTTQLGKCTAAAAAQDRAAIYEAVGG